MIVFWITEAIPLPADGAFGRVRLAFCCKSHRPKKCSCRFADPLIFLFIGAFILARAIFLHRLDRRLAFGILALPWIGARPVRILIAFGR